MLPNPPRKARREASGMYISSQYYPPMFEDGFTPLDVAILIKKGLKQHCDFIFYDTWIPECWRSYLLYEYSHTVPASL